MDSKQTSVENLRENEVIEGLKNFSILSDDEIYKNIFDLSLPLEDRLKLFNLYFQKYPTEIANITNRLNSMYVFSYSKIIEEFLYEIVLQTSIDLYLKLESSKVLTYNSSKGYEALDYICSLKDKSLATICKVDAISNLLKNKDYKDKAYTYLLNITNDYSLECLYRYSIILSLDRSIENVDIKKDFIKRLCIQFLQNEENLITGRILASQNLLRNCEPDIELRNFIENNLLSFGRDENLNENVRADAIDVLLQFGSDESRQEATRLIMLLGTRNGGRTIFQNSQNVHHRSIEESANKILEALNCIQSKNKEKVEIDFDYVRNQILENIKDKTTEIKEKIEMSLTRIFLDRAVYSQYNMSLLHILTKMWAYIENSDYSEDMKERLIEELYDASEVCSTGYAFRIVNVLSGYGDLNITISFEEQIIGNLEGRLNAKIREIEDEDYQSDVMNEMIVDPSHFHSRSNFLKFFRTVISKIREDMYTEFKDFMSDTDYDMYFRKALIHYEGYN